MRCVILKRKETSKEKIHQDRLHLFISVMSETVDDIIEVKDHYQFVHLD